MSEGPDSLAARLERSRDETRSTLHTLAELKGRVDAVSARLESPSAVAEFIDFFSGFFTEAATTLDRLAVEATAHPERRHAEALRQLASNAALEQRRALKFRDKCINRPLPYEDVRPLLSEISNQTGLRLTSYRDLNLAAAELDALAGPDPQPHEDGRPLDRRQLFTKWFGK
jgi:hypothetical protein